MKAISITKEGIVEYYGNRAGYVRNDTAYIDEMFKKADIEEFLTKENGISIEWQKDIYERLIKGDIEDSDQLTLKKCRLYQLKPDTNYQMRFIGYKELKDKGFGEPNIADYRLVYDGNVSTNDLEGIYALFDSKNPLDGFDENGIYISDVIELYDENSSEFYYINSSGFKKLTAFNEPRIDAEREYEKPFEEVSEKAQNAVFEAVKAEETMIDIPKEEPHVPEPADESKESEMPSEKEPEFQIETFRIIM